MLSPDAATGIDAQAATAGTRGRSPGPQARAWGAALVLIIIVFVFTILARVISALFSRKHQT